MRHAVNETFENLNDINLNPTCFNQAKTTSSLKRPALLLLLSITFQFSAQSKVIPSISKNELKFTIDLISNDMQKQQVIKKYISLNEDVKKPEIVK